MTSLAPIAVAARARLASTRVNGTFAAGAGLFGTIVALCVLVPLFVNTSTTDFVGIPLTGPSLAHPFGTDAFGRDVFI
nr:ABC transporter permease [Streptomyces sp. DSM 41633]